MMVKKTSTSMKLAAAFLLALPLGANKLWGKETSVSIPKIVPPEVRGGRQEIPLPEVVDEVCVGGGGRYLALHFKSLKKIGIFDVNRLKIAGYISASDGDTKFAAGATKLITVSGDSGVVARWDLATQQRELAQSVDLGGSAGHALLGSASAGPAIISGVGRDYSGSAFLLDLESLRTERLVVTNNSRGFGARANLRISADGKVIGCWASGTSPSGLQTYVNVGGAWKGHYEHDSAGCLVPSPDGRLIYTSSGVYTNQLRRLGGEADRGYSIPAVHGPFALSVANEASLGTVSLKMEGDNRPLAQISGLKPTSGEGSGKGSQTLTLEERLFLIPDADLVLHLVSGHSKLIAIHFDIEKALRESPIDFLLISSRPPLAVQAGERLAYQIEVVSKSGGVKYSLDAGPPGMSVSPAGLLTWAANASSPAENNVIVTVSDKTDQQVFHTFSLAVRGGATATAPQEAPSASRPARRTARATISTKPTELSANALEIKLPGTLNNVVVGGAGRFILLHLRDLKKIAVLDVSKARIAGYLPASDDNTKVVAGATRALIFSPTQGVVTRYRLDTLERELSVAIPFNEPIQYVGMGAGSEGPVLLRTSQGTGQIDSCRFHFMDINTMKPRPISWENGNPPHSVYRDFNDIHVSTNGEAFSVQGIGVLRLQGTTVRVASGENRGFGGYPTADGRYFLSNGRLFNSDLRQIGDQSSNFGVAVPSVTGSYFLSFSPRESNSDSSRTSNSGAKLYMIGDSRPLVTISDLVLPDLATGGYHNMLGWNRRLLFIPDAQVILTIPSTNDRVLLRRFKIDDALEASGVDYLVVASQAPALASLGKTYVYGMKVKSKRGGVKFSLDSAPAGMKVSADGKITWDVPAEMTEAKTNVIVSVRDASGQETFHTFTIEIAELKEKVAAAQKDRSELLRNTRIDVQRKEMERRQALLLEGRAARQAENPSASRQFRPVMRTWTDNSGQRKLTAKFVEVTDRNTLVLELENGEQRKVPLSRLSNEDIYEAVRSDLLRQGTKVSGTASTSAGQP